MLGMAIVKRAILVIIAAIIIAPLGFYFGYKLLYPTYTYRYRLSVEVETPDGTRAGSSVIEVRYEIFPEINGRDHVSRVFGEAVFVDLGRGKNLIGLLAAGPSGEDVDYPGRIVFLAFDLDGNDKNTPKRLPLLRGKRDLDIYRSSLYDVTKRFLPTFVTFRDLTDFKSVKIAPPGLFDEVFGPDYKLRNVSIEMTDGPVTEQISRNLPWLPHPGYFNGHVGCGPGDPTYCLHGGHFMRSN
jgi:hypothetical protein